MLAAALSTCDEFVSQMTSCYPAATSALPQRRRATQAKLRTSAIRGLKQEDECDFTDDAYSRLFLGAVHDGQRYSQMQGRRNDSSKERSGSTARHSSEVRCDGFLRALKGLLDVLAFLSRKLPGLGYLPGQEVVAGELLIDAALKRSTNQNIKGRVDLEVRHPKQIRHRY